MGRTKLTQEQKDLIAVLPSAITKSEIYQKLTDAQRLVLAQIDLQDGTDFSAENGYIYTTNEELMKNTGIASNRTVIDAVRRLVNEGLITTKRGFRNKEGREASEYVLTDTYYKLCERENPHKELHYMGCNKKNVGCNCSSYYTEETNNQIEVMQQKINELTQRVQELESLVGCNKEKSYYTTDTDSETDIDTDTIVHEGNVTSNNKTFKNNIKEMVHVTKKNRTIPQYDFPEYNGGFGVIRFSTSPMMYVDYLFEKGYIEDWYKDDRERLIEAISQSDIADCVKSNLIERIRQYRRGA